jgi:hypothetical protein
MRIRRDLASVPLRTASETWNQLVELVTGVSSQDVNQLRAAAGTMGSIITDEHPKDRPIIFEGVGPQLRIYLLYGEDAVSAGEEVDSLTWAPTAGNWTLHVPCDAENLEWVRRSLGRTSPRIKAYDSAGAAWRDDGAPTTKKSSGFQIDWSVKG